MNKNLQSVVSLSLIILINFIITTFIYYISFSKGYDGISLFSIGNGDDGYFYWAQAINILNGRAWVQTSIYPLLIGYIMKFSGIHHVYLIRIINLIALIFVYIVSVQVLKKAVSNNGEKEFHISTIYISFFLLILLWYPSLLLYTHLSIYRDVWIYLLYLFNILLSISLVATKKQKFIKFTLLLIGLYLLYGFREYATFSFLTAVISFLLYAYLQERGKAKLFISLFVFAFIVYYSFFIDFNIPIINKSLKDVLLFRSEGIEFFSGGSQMNIVLVQPNILLFLVNYAMSFVGNLVGPLIWQVTGISTFFVFVTESIPLILTLIILYRKRHLLNKVESYLLLHGLIWNGFISIFNDNIGTASRLRVPTIILLIIICFSMLVRLKNENGKKNI